MRQHNDETSSGEHQITAKYVQENGKSNEIPTNFEEAISLTGNGRFHYLLLAVCGLCLISVMNETFSTSFLLPSAQCDFQLTSEDKGLLNSICNIGMICSSHLWGFLADTRGRKKVIVFTLLMDSLCTILSAFAHAFWLFLALRFLNGFFIVGPASVVYAYVGEFHGAQTRSKAIMWVCVFIGLGIALQPAIAWLVIPQPWSFELPWCTFNSWRVFVLLCAAPGLLAAIVLILWFPESPKFLMVADKKEEALQVLRNMYACNTGNSAQRFPVKSLVLIEDEPSVPVVRSRVAVLEVVLHMWRQTKPLFQSPYLSKTLLVCLIQYGLYASANGLSLWLPDVFNHLAEFAAAHPNSPGSSVCQSYATPSTHTNILDSMAFGMTNSSIPELRVNDTLRLSCDMDQVILKINNAIAPLEHNMTFLHCHNGTLFSSINSNMLLFNMDNGTVTLDLLDTTIRNYKTYVGISEKEIECKSDVDFSAFQNTLILGVVSAVGYVIVGLLIGPLSKKTILVTNLLVAGITGVAMNYVYTMWEVLLVAGAFVTLSGMCISVVISAVVDIFPTHLRAMAVCLSLMIGRLGSVTINILLGILLEVNCSLMIFILGGSSISCGLLCILLPSPKSLK